MPYPPEQFTKFVVLFLGRSGSTYLMETLRSHSTIRARGEHLFKLKTLGSAAQIQWTREFFTLPAQVPYRAIGFRTKLSDVVDADEFADLLRSLDVRIIHLDRHNLVKQAISWLNSEQLHETTGAWNLYRAADRLPPLEVDQSKFADYLALLVQGRRRLGRYVANLRSPTLHITYEDLLVDYQDTIMRVFKFLEVPPDSVESRIRKTTNDNLRLAISNFAELRAQYAGTTYEPMFDEVLVDDSPIRTQRPKALYPFETVKKFVVLFQGRSGSTHLIQALRSHTRIQARFEVLVPLKEQGFAAQAQWMRNFFTLPSLVPFTAIGFKTKLTDVADVDEFANLLRSMDVRIIHLERRNVVKQAVSWLNSERLHEATGDWNLYREANRLPPLEADLTMFADYLNLLEQGKRWLRHYVDSLALPTLHITYEDLLLDFEETMARVLEFLGAPPEQLVSGVKKTTSDDLRVAVSNFRELRAQYSGTAYEPMFDEVLTAGAGL